MTGCCPPPGGGRRSKRPAGPKRLAPRKRRPAVRAAVCAACALALVAGTVTLWPIGGGETTADGAPVTALPAFSFGLTAYAADTGERYEANANGGLAFSTSGQGSLVRRGRTLYRLPVPGDGREHPDHLPGHRPGGAVPQQDSDRPLQGGGAEVPGGRGQRHGVPAARRRRGDQRHLQRRGRRDPDPGCGDGPGRQRHGGL